MQAFLVKEKREVLLSLGKAFTRNTQINQITLIQVWKFIEKSHLWWTEKVKLKLINLRI